MSPEQHILEVPQMTVNKHWKPLPIVKMWHNLSALIGLVQRGMIIIHTNHFCPPPDYTFPKGEDGRTFQHRWLQMFPWLVYIASTGYQNSNPGVLVNRPLKSFSKALELFSNHVDKEHHKIAVVKADYFKKTMTNQQLSIQSSFSRESGNQ